jgi:hypothetical protein
MSTPSVCNISKWKRNINLHANSLMLCIKLSYVVLYYTWAWRRTYVWWLWWHFAFINIELPLPLSQYPTLHTSKLLQSPNQEGRRTVNWFITCQNLKILLVRMRKVWHHIGLWSVAERTVPCPNNGGWTVIVLWTTGKKTLVRGRCLINQRNHPPASWLQNFASSWE